MVVSLARAELPSIRLDRIKPLGAAAGSSIELEINAADSEDANELRFDHPGLSAEFVKPGRFKVSVAAGVPEGTYDVRLVGRFGASNPRLFAVSQGLADVAEKEPNNAPPESQAVAINSAVSGTSDGNGQDLFRFTARKGQRLTLECQAGKLDSELDASLAVIDSSGALLASNADYRGRDPTIDFMSPADGEYLVEVHDLSYRGGYPYRLLVTDRPCVENVFPRAVEPGRATELVALGYNFGTAGQASNWKIDDRSLEEYRFTFTPPSVDEARGAFRFLEHPTDHSVLPTAATCTLNGFQVRVPVGTISAPAVTLMAAEGPVTLEQEPNDEANRPQSLTLPATVSGRFDRPRDADWYEFVAAEAGRYDIQVFSERIAGQADPYVVVMDDKDARLEELDDFGIRMNAFDGHLRDPVGSVNLAAGRKYRLMVQDRYSRGGARYQYVLTVRRPSPDFFAAAIHSSNPNPSGINLGQGGATYLDLVIHRRDGFDGPITIEAEGLPPGLHAAAVKVPSDTRCPFVLWADADMSPWIGAVRLVAKGLKGEESFQRDVRPYTRVWNNANMGSSRPTRELIVAVREKAPYALNVVPANDTITSGGKLELKLEAMRHWADFKAPIRVIGLSLPGGFNLTEGQIAAGKTDGTCTLQLGNMRPGEYTLTLMGQAQVPFHKDPASKDRPNTLVSIPSRPITIKVIAEMKK